jgi:hypothetical protein
VRKEEKRRRHNIDGFIEFVTKSKNTNDTVVSNIVSILSAEQILQIIHIFRKTQYETLNCLNKYTHRFKQAADELTLEDIEEAKALLAVRTVHES